jgi:predicted acyl esterase
VRSGIIFGLSQAVPQSRYDPSVAALLQDILSERDTPALRDFLAKRSVRAQLRGFNIPTLMLQGRRDFAFSPDQALSAFKLLTGPKRLYLGNLGHTPAANPPAELQYYAGQVLTWFERYVKGIPQPPAAHDEVLLAADPWTGRVKSYVGPPPTRSLTFTFKTSATLTAAGKVVRTTARVPHLETFGAPTVRVRISSRTQYRHLVAVLSAVRRDGSELVVTDGGAETSTLGRAVRTITLHLPDEITSIPSGSRLRVTLAATSTAQSVQNLVYLNSVPGNSTAVVRRVTLALPVLRKPVSP